MTPQVPSSIDLPLRDFHLPPPVGFWPLAPGWWLLGGLFLATTLGILSWRLWCRHRLRRLALARLEQLAQLPEEQLAAPLSRLLRQAVIGHFPADHAGLQGQTWLEFLDRPFADRPFSSGVGRCLADSPYRPESRVDKAALIPLCRRWLQALPAPPRHARWGG